MNVAQETLGFRRQSFSLCLSLLMSAFALPMAPASLSTHLHSPTERSPTIQGPDVRCRMSGTSLRLPAHSIEHLRNRFVLVTPAPPVGRTHVPEIQGITQPNPHFIRRTNRHLQIAT